MAHRHRQRDQARPQRSGGLIGISERLGSSSVFMFVTITAGNDMRPGRAIRPDREHHAAAQPAQTLRRCSP